MKLIQKLGLVVVTVCLIALVLVPGIGAIGNAAVGEYSCYCTQPVLSLAQENIYWGSYADYSKQDPVGELRCEQFIRQLRQRSQSADSRNQQHGRSKLH